MSRQRGVRKKCVTKVTVSSPKILSVIQSNVLLEHRQCKLERPTSAKTISNTANKRPIVGIKKHTFFAFCVFFADKSNAVKSQITTNKNERKRAYYSVFCLYSTGNQDVASSGTTGIQQVMFFWNFFFAKKAPRVKTKEKQNKTKTTGKKRCLISSSTCTHSISIKPKKKRKKRIIVASTSIFLFSLSKVINKKIQFNT